MLHDLFGGSTAEALSAMAKHHVLTPQMAVYTLPRGAPVVDGAAASAAADPCGLSTSADPSLDSASSFNSSFTASDADAHFARMQPQNFTVPAMEPRRLSRFATKYEEAKAEPASKVLRR